MNTSSSSSLARNINTTFTIRSLRCAIVEHMIIPQRVVFSCAGKHDRSHCLVVSLDSAEGVTGYGEASCVAIWSGETADTAAVLLRNILRPALEGKTFTSPIELCDLMDRVLIDNSFLKSAIDIAAWDMVARSNHVSVMQLIQDRDPVPRIPVRASIGAHPVDRTVELACEFWSLGIRTLKFKTGLDTDEDVRRIAAVRDALGDEPILTVDYNAGLTSAKAAIKAIGALEPYGLSLVEQPTPRHRYSMMAEVRRNVRPPILADEGIFSPQQLEEAIALDAMDILSIYPGKNGGFTRSWQMALLAQQAGVPCVIGSNLEPELAQAAMGCLASSLAAFPIEGYASDLLSVMYYQGNPLTPLRPLVDACYDVPLGIGFGVDVDVKQLGLG